MRPGYDKAVNRKGGIWESYFFSKKTKRKGRKEGRRRASRDKVDNIIAKFPKSDERKYNLDVGKIASQ